MEVVREHGEGVDMDLESLRRDREQVEKHVVRGLGRPEKESTLGAPPSH